MNCITAFQPYNEDIEYIDEAKDRWSQKTELVGALKPEDLDWRPQKLNISKLGTYYAGLAKSRLTGMSEIRINFKVLNNVKTFHITIIYINMK